MYEKLTIAINHNADFLLFVTTSNFSPPCRDEVQRHNEGHSVKIRIWPFYYLEQLLTIHGQVAVKYGLIEKHAALHVDFQSIMFELKKLALATYGALEFGKDPTDRITLLASFTELIYARIEDTKSHGRFTTHRFKPARDTYDWCSPNPLSADKFDSSSLRAALSSIKFILSLGELDCKATGDKVVVTVPSTNALRSNQLFGLVSTFGLIDWELKETQIILKTR